MILSLKHRYHWLCGIGSIGANVVCLLCTFVVCNRTKVIQVWRVIKGK